MVMSPRQSGRLRLGITTWLWLVSGVALLPMLVFMAIGTSRLLDDERQAASAALERRAAVAAAAVQREIGSFTAVLKVLGTSDAGGDDGSEALHAHARRVVAEDPRIVSISLTTPDGRHLFHTGHPWGAALPPSAVAAAQTAALAKGRPAVSPLVVGAVSREPVAGVAIALHRPGSADLALRLAFRPEALGAVLAEQRWPADWTGAVVDQKGVIVARSREPERYVGAPVTPSISQALGEGRTGVFEAVTKDDIVVVTSVAPVSGTGWHVVVGQPKAALDEQARRALLQPVAIGVLCLLLALASSTWLARHVGAEVRALARAGSASPPAPSAVAEVGTIRDTLGRVRAEADRHAQALHGARHDGLTGLAGRSLFMEDLALRLRAVAAAPGQPLALLYVDLDGFKQVNDSQGHEAGDRVLAAVAEILRRHTRASDLAGRLGGDEFVLALQLPDDGPAAVADEVARRLVAEIAHLGQGIGASIGAVWAAPGERAPELMARADLAMYAAKRAGKGLVHWAP